MKLLIATLFLINTAIFAVYPIPETGDPYRKKGVFNINNHEHFAKDYHQFDMEEDEEFNYLNIDDLTIPQEEIDKALRIQNNLPSIDSSLEELDKLIELEAIIKLFFEENFIEEGEDEPCENGFTNEECSDDYKKKLFMIERVRALKKEVYKTITKPFEFVVLDWIISHRIDKKIWDGLGQDGIDYLLSIEDPEERKNALREISIEIFEVIKGEFYNKDGEFNETYRNYIININEITQNSLNELAADSPAVLIGDVNPVEPEYDTSCDFRCENTGGECIDAECFCEAETLMAFDEDKDGVNDYCVVYDEENISTNCELSANSEGEICNGHGVCQNDTCVCEIGYRLYNKTCVANYLNLLNDPISIAAYHENISYDDGLYYADQVWWRTKLLPKIERFHVAKKVSKTFFDSVRKGDVLSVRGRFSYTDFITGIFSHSTMAIKDMALPDGYIPDPDEKTFISSRKNNILWISNKGVDYESRRMYQYLYYGDSHLNEDNADGYLYTPKYSVIFAQTPYELKIGFRIKWVKISFWLFTVKFPVPYPYFYYNSPSNADRDKAVNYAIAQLGKPYNLTFYQYLESKFYCSSLVWRAWDKVRDNLLFGYDIDSTINPTVRPVDIFTDWNTQDTRGIIYKRILEYEALLPVNNFL